MFQASTLADLVIGPDFLNEYPTMELNLNPEFPSLTPYPIAPQMLTFLPLGFDTNTLYPLDGPRAFLKAIVTRFEACGEPTLLVLTARPAYSLNNKPWDQPPASIIFGVFTTAALGLLSGDVEYGSATTPVVQVFQLQPQRRVFSANPTDVTLSCDRERPSKSGVAFTGPMIGVPDGKVASTTLLIRSRGAFGIFERRKEWLNFEIDSWWLFSAKVDQEESE